jgi:predicted Zn-dependent protease
VTSGAKWDHEVVTWSFAQSGGNFSGSMGTSEEQAVQKAFDQWASATGLKFKEVSGSAKSDIRIGWGSFDTADTGVVGFTTVKTKKKAGAIVSAVVRLENPSENAFVSSASGGQVYAGTDASFDQVLLHEIGHVIGFRDNADPSSIENYALTDANRTLGSNDIAAAGALYGKPVLLAAVTPVSSGSAADIIQAMSSFAPAPMAVAARAANDATIVSDALAAGFHGERSPRYSAR